MPVRVEVETSHLAFQGHFPGDPVLPGIVQIDLVLAALRERLGGEWHVTGIPSARWRAAVRPGSALELHVTDPGGDGRVAFELRIGETLVSHGTLIVAKARG